MDNDQLLLEYSAMLKEMPSDKVDVIAFRASLRAMPLLMQYSASNTPPFGYWEKKVRSKHLLALFRALVFAGLIVERGSDFRYISVCGRFLRGDVSRDHDDSLAIEPLSGAILANREAAIDGLAQIVTGVIIGAALGGTNTHILIAAAATITPMLKYQFDADLKVLRVHQSTTLRPMPLWHSRSVLQELKGLFSFQYLREMRLWLNWREALERDALSLDPGFAIWLEWYGARLRGEPIDVSVTEALNGVPKEKLVQSPSAIQAYVKSMLASHDALSLNRVRAFFIGHGEVGKTSLVRVLHGELVLPGIGNMTPGIDIREWDGAGGDISTHFWDFGGQVIAHATHQFFLRAQCVYVLVLEARKSNNPNEDAEYWLQHVRAFGGDAPVLVVGNKHDQNPVDLEMHSLRSKYPNIVGFFPVSCTLAQTDYAPAFASFKSAFCEQIQQIGTRQRLFSRNEFAVLQLVREHAKNNAFSRVRQLNA